MGDNHYTTGGHHRPTHFWCGVILGTIVAGVYTWGWNVSATRHVLVVIAAGLATGLLARQFGDEFWETLIRWWGTWR